MCLLTIEKLLLNNVQRSNAEGKQANLGKLLTWHGYPEDAWDQEFNQQAFHSFQPAAQSLREIHNGAFTAASYGHY